MKKHILQKLAVFTLLAMLLSLLVSVPASAATGAGNMVSDGEFKSGIGSQYFWNYYTASGQTSNADTVTISANEGIGGSSCLKLSGGVKCGVKSSITVPEKYAGTQYTYTFSAYCKATKGAVQYFPYIKVLRYDKDGKQVGVDVELLNDATTVNYADQWIKITKTLTLQASVSFFELYIRTADTANTTTDDYVLFDNIMIYKPEEYPTQETNLFTTTKYGYGFENMTDSGTLTGDTAGYNWKTDTDADGNYIAHGGKAYLRLYNGKGGATYSYALENSLASVVTREPFRLSFWLKASTTDKGTANGVAAVEIKRVTATGSTAGSTLLTGSSKVKKVGDYYYMTPEKAETWEKFTIYFDFGAEGTAIYIKPAIANGVPGGTSICFDDVVLTRVPTSTMHSFGDLYDSGAYDNRVGFSAGDKVYAETYFVPETEGATGTMLSMLYEELNDGTIVLRDCKVKALATKGHYESEFTVPTEGKHFAKSCIWSIGENTISAMEDSILITQQAS